MKFKVGEIVGIKTGAPSIAKYPSSKAVVLAIEDNNLFESVKCIKIIELGTDKITYQLSDRLYKL